LSEVLFEVLRFEEIYIITYRIIGYVRTYNKLWRSWGASFSSDVFMDLL